MKSHPIKINLNAYLNFVQRFPKSILLGLIMITVYLGYMTTHLTEDSNPYLIPQDHPARSSLFKLREQVTGTYDAILIALHNPQGILNPHSLQAIFELSQRLQALHVIDAGDLEGLQQLQQRYAGNTDLQQHISAIAKDGLNHQDIYSLRALAQWAAASASPLSPQDRHLIQVLVERLDPVRAIDGLAASENVFLEADGTLRVAMTVDSVNSDIAAVSNALMDNELFERGIIDRPQHTSQIIVEISLLDTDAVGQLRAYQKVSQLVAQYQQDHPQLKDEIYIAGTPVFFAEQKRILDRDMATLFPLVLVLVSLILALFFRTWLGVMIPLVNVVMCTVWTLGAMAIVGIPLDLITSVLPVFLITICSSDAIHLMAEYYQQRQQQATHKQALETTLKLMVSPVILTTLTTCITFAVSTSSAISNLRHFGLSMSFGMFVAMIISLLLIPAWLSLLSDKTLAKVTATSRSSPFISQLLLQISRPLMQYRRRFTLGLIALLGLLAVIATQVRIDDMGSAYFAKDNRYRLADEFINQHIGGSSPGWIEIDTGRPDGALSIEALDFINRLETFIHQQDNITFSYSLARYIRRINFLLNDGDPAHNRLPAASEHFTEIDPDTGERYTLEVAGQDIIRQAVLLYENGGGSDLSNVLSADFSKSVLLYTMNTTVASDYQRFLAHLRPWLDANIPAGITYQLAGTPVIWTAVLDELISSQLHSIFIAFLCVLLVMSLWLRSFKLGLLGSLPLLATVVCYYAIMTLLDIELNIGTAIIAFLVLGIVDYSVHYLLRTRHGLQQGLSVDQALEQSIIYSGRSIIINVLVFSLGFIALLFSEFQPIVDLGLLVGLSLLISGVMSILIITLLAPRLIAPEN